MKFEFKINKYYLVSHAITQSKKPFPAWIKLEKRLWQKYKNEPAYYFLNPKHIKWALEQMQINSINQNLELVFNKNTKILKKIYNEIFKTKEFERLYEETKKYLIFVKGQWRKNRKQALDFVFKTSGIDITKEKIIVFITHPKLKNGRVITDKNIILWGHSEDWKNYSTVYICHELMHLLTWKRQGNTLIMHVIIELMTDNELRIFLQNSSEKNMGLIGHKKLLPLRKKILPYWKDYFKNPTNIFNLEKEIIKRIPPKKVREG